MSEEINIELPESVIQVGKHTQINFSAMENKVIIGLVGYAKSGKDFITKYFVDEYGYQRVAFADNIKKEMNLHLKTQVVKDIFEKTGIYLDPEKLDFFSEDIETKKLIRPYIIWYGEKLRKVNGTFCWINRAFEEDGKDMDKIILSDVRRLPELNIFKNSNEFAKRTAKCAAEVGLYRNLPTTKNFGTLLFEVNQFKLKDSDQLTIDTILEAREQWLIDDTFYVDSRLPEDGNFRQKAIEIQIKKVVKKFGIVKPDKVKNIQTNIFQTK
jgi:hypothetical protein